MGNLPAATSAQTPQTVAILGHLRCVDGARARGSAPTPLQ